MTSNLTSINALEDQDLLGDDLVFASICAQIAACAEADPDAVAVADAAGSLTYGMLVRRASRLAARLRATGVAPGDCVALFLDRGTEFVVAACGILWAGAAYLPVDTTSPSERVGFVLADAHVALVLTSAHQQARLPGGPWRPLVVDGADSGTSHTQVAPPAPAGPDDLAYVIYTSGSTGQPKGVELTHANLANLVDWHVTAFGVGPTDRASQVASVGFDAAVWEIWPHLAAGAAVHLADDATRSSPQLLRDWIVERAITVSFVPTALAEQVIHLPWPEDTALRVLLTGADVLHRRPPGGLPFRLVNNYGPTECTVVTTSGAVAPEGEGHATPSIGRPITNATVLIMDEKMRPVRTGEPGELCVAGALVGRGYRNDPDLTASRFVAVTSGDGPYADTRNGGTVRVYRTGDLVRLLENGEIAFLGRLDNQVKIRGYRIEPAEIVAAIQRFPGVAASAVVARLPSGRHPTDSHPTESHPTERDAPPGEPELIAYVVSAHGADSPTAPDLRANLASQLPEYMVPAKFVGVDALPMTINGKLDASALPAPTAENLLQGPAAQSDPVNDGGGSIEEQMAAIVGSLLDVPAVDPTDNIFLIGGHSMLAMQLVMRIRQTFEVKLALREVFGAPTVAGLAAEVIRRRSAAATAGAR